MSDMPSMWPRNDRRSIRIPGADSEGQLRLPLYREISPRSGLLSRNTEAADRIRLFLQGHLPVGSVGRIAGQISSPKSRVYDELEGRVVLSIDVALAALTYLRHDHCLRLFAAVSRPFGILPFDTAARDLDESIA